MKYRDPLNKILLRTQLHWDSEKSRRSVRNAFRKSLLCRTPALGAEIYASENEEKVIYHTCKSPACASCGHRATAQWLNERLAVLPDVPYKGISFTMPSVLWSVFRENLQLTRVLPKLAAVTIQTWAGVSHGLDVGLIAVLHTFNGRLQFNCHVHTMVTAGGRQSSGAWISSMYYDRERLTALWRRGVIQLLRAAMQEGLLESEVSSDNLEAILAEQETRWWNISIQSLGSKEHFLKYAGRYVRRPVIASRRIVYIGEEYVTFWAKDKRLGGRVKIKCSLIEFVDRLARHVPEHYQHSVRSFGLFAPRRLRNTSAVMFLLLGQIQRPRPKRVPWNVSIRLDFGWDPLLDRTGQRMKWVGRKKARSPASFVKYIVARRPYIPVLRNNTLPHTAYE